MMMMMMNLTFDRWQAIHALQQKYDDGPTVIAEAVFPDFAYTNLVTE